MDELVKRLRAAAIMSEALSIFLPHSEGSAVAKLYNEAADAIEELSKPKWIPVTERLPDKIEDVLIYGEWTGVSGTKYREIWLTDLESLLHQGYKPIAWMPLPQPPKEE